MKVFLYSILSLCLLTPAYPQIQIQETSKRLGFRNAETNSVYFNYTIGDPMPSPEMFSVTSSGANPVGLSLTVQQGSLNWLDASLSSITTPAIVSIGLRQTAIPPAGNYQATVTVSSPANTLSWFVFLTVSPAPTAPVHPMLSHFACGGGWSTTLYLTNTAPTTNVARVDILGSDGKPLAIGPLGSSRIIVLGMNGTQSIELDNSVCESLKTGSVTTNLSDTIRGYAVFRQEAQGTQTQEAVVPLSMPTTWAQLIYDQRNSLVTAMALANGSQTAPTSIVLTAYNESGDITGYSTQTLAPGEQRSFVLSSVIPLASKGTITMKSVTVPFTGLGLRFAGRAFTSIPLI